MANWSCGRFLHVTCFLQIGQFQNNLRSLQIIEGHCKNKLTIFLTRCTLSVHAHTNQSVNHFKNLMCCLKIKQTAFLVCSAVSGGDGQHIVAGWTDRRKDTQKNRRMERGMGRQTYKHMDRHMDKWTDRQTERQTDRQRDRRRDRQTDRQIDRETGGGTDRETDGHHGKIGLDWDSACAISIYFDLICLSYTWYNVMAKLCNIFIFTFQGSFHGCT